MVMTEDSKELRIDMGATDPLSTINRSAAARYLGVHVSVISRILSPKHDMRRYPHILTFRRLAEYLGLSMDVLYRLLYSVDGRK